MIIITIITLIVAIALLLTKISPLQFSRLTAITFLFSAFLSFNALYIESLGSGIGIYSGLDHVSTVILSTETLTYLMGAFILVTLFILPFLLYKSSLLEKDSASIHTNIALDYYYKPTLFKSAVFISTGKKFFSSSSMNPSIKEDSSDKYPKEGKNFFPLYQLSNFVSTHKYYIYSIFTLVFSIYIMYDNFHFYAFLF